MRISELAQLDELTPMTNDAARRVRLIVRRRLPILVKKLAPGAGYALMLGFAYDSFKSGDIVGGGLELMSMIPGPAGWAVIATAVAREIYNEFYADPTTGKPARLEQDLIADPKGTGENIQQIAEYVVDEIRAHYEQARSERAAQFKDGPAKGTELPGGAVAGHYPHLTRQAAPK